MVTTTTITSPSVTPRRDLHFDDPPALRCSMLDVRCSMFTFDSIFPSLRRLPQRYFQGRMPADFKILNPQLVLPAECQLHRVRLGHVVRPVLEDQLLVQPNAYAVIA